MTPSDALKSPPIDLEIASHGVVLTPPKSFVSLPRSDVWPSCIPTAPAYGLLPPETFTEPLSKWVPRRVDKTGGIAVVHTDARDHLALAACVPAPFDSQHLRVSMARLVGLGGWGDTPRAALLRGALMSLLQQCQVQGIAHVSCRVDETAHLLQQLLAACGFVERDQLLTYRYTRAQARMIPARYARMMVRAGRPDDLAELHVLARRFQHTRYGADPLFSAMQVERLFRAWMKNVFTARYGEAVLVAVRRERPVGFVAYTRQDEMGVSGVASRVIGGGLAAVLPSAVGAGVALVKAVCQRIDQGYYDAAEFDTQPTNRSMCRILGRYQLPCTRQQRTYHWTAPYLVRT